LVFYFSGGNKEPGDISAEDMIAKLEADGYRVFTEAEYISMSVDDADTEETESSSTEDDSASEDEKHHDESDEDDKSDADGDSEEDAEDSPVTYSLEIKSGMVSSDIGKLLE